MSAELFILVFAATSLVSAIVVATAYKVMQAKALARHPEGDVSAENIPPLRRFVSEERLVKLRFVVSCIFSVSIVVFLSVKDVYSLWIVIPAMIGFGIFGWKAPMMYYARKIKLRKEFFDAQILNLTMTLANGLRSGQALPQALDAAAKRIPPPMQEELIVVLKETRLGLDLPEALERLYSRMPSEDLRLLITSIRLTLQAGGSLSEVLERMVAMIRSRTEFQEKVKTMTAQGRFEAIAMSLAPLFVYILLRLIDPPLMKPLTSTVAGWCAIVAVTVMISVGFFVINKIVTIEV